VLFENTVEIRFATDRGLLNWHDTAQHLLGHDGILTEQLDAEESAYRAAVVIDGAFEDCLAVAAGGTPPMSVIRVMVANHSREPLEPIVARRVSCEQPDDRGTVICVCLGVGLQTVQATSRCWEQRHARAQIAVRVSRN
jgi:hypothetical protein